MKILMIRLSAIGDVVRTLPALSCLRRAYPGAHIAWAVEEAAAGLLTEQPGLDETLIFPRRKLARALLHPRELGQAREALGGFLRALRESRFDLVVDFQGTLKSAFLARLTGARRIVGLGRGQAREMSHLFYTERVRLPRKKMNRVARSLALVEHVGAPIDAANATLPESLEDAAYVETFLAGMRAYGEGVAPAVIFPGTSRAQAYKRYPPQHFARAADIVSERSGSRVVVAWGPGEEDIAEQVVASMKVPGAMAPPLTLGQLIALIRRSRVFIAGDTGPMHIAWTVGTPVVAVYGPTDPLVNRPGGAFSAVAYEKIFCSPCRNRGCIAVTCLQNLRPEKVADAALGVIARAEAGGTAIRATSTGPAAVQGGPSRETLGPGASGNGFERS